MQQQAVEAVQVDVKLEVALRRWLLAARSDARTTPLAKMGGLGQVEGVRRLGR
jgi:hypothetical protein